MIIDDRPPATTLMSCFNCRRSEAVHLYRFDLDLPAVAACRVCGLALACNDHEMLAALRPGRSGRRTR